MGSLAAAGATIGGLSLLHYVDAKLGISMDVPKGKGLFESLWTLKSRNAQDANSVYTFFENSAKAYPDEPCLVFEGTTLSWRQTLEAASRLAHFLSKQGFKRGNTFALIMGNKPAYVITWLAAMQIDLVPAFINNGLTGKPLEHCIKIAESKFVFYDAELEEAVSEVKGTLPEGLKYFKWIDPFVKKRAAPGKEIADATPVSAPLIAEYPSTPFPPSARSGISWQSPTALIYTSGTTGLPKAALVTHGRTSTAMIVYARVNKFTQKDRIYTPMPLYHATAMLLGVAASWVSSSTIIIGRKFSSTQYWNEVRDNDATIIQYVGEVLRYLVNTPHSSLDKKHNVRLAYGNGCRPDVWNKFRDRFGVETISEFFASTEGNGTLINVNSNVYGSGAVGHEGFLQWLVRHNKQTLIKMDPFTEEPLRGPNGLCQRTDYGEGGELICYMDQSSPFAAFAGYYGNQDATNKKILTDVFRKGDQWFRTGDLLIRDANGFYYFGDRMGDTFRWKSENVSTAQVAESIGKITDEVNVYGVVVPNHDGRAGCAAFKVASNVDLEAVAVHCARDLPRYAIPQFVRIVPDFEVTGTGKQQKVKLRDEGIDPAKTGKDPVYWLRNGRYVPFTKDDYQILKDGKLSL